ncbi:hypothetical protein Kompost2_00004 [Pseudomonas phage vB_PpuP-Kompost-2]
MSTRTDRLRNELADLDERIKLAEADHQAAKATFGRFEGSAATPLWEKLRNEVDGTLTRCRVLEAVWHRTKADLLEQLNTDKE